jgi:hypothetical protein
MTNHMTGDSEVERDLRKVKTAHQALTETWEDSPTGWPQQPIIDTLRTKGRPTAQWSRLKAGRSDNLGTTPR